MSNLIKLDSIVSQLGAGAATQADSQASYRLYADSQRIGNAPYLKQSDSLVSKKLNQDGFELTDAKFAAIELRNCFEHVRLAASILKDR